MDVSGFCKLLSKIYIIPIKHCEHKIDEVKEDMVNFCMSTYGDETSDAINCNLNKYDYFFIAYIMFMLRPINSELCFEISMLFWFCVEILDNEYSINTLMDRMKINKDAGQWLLDNIMDVAEIRASSMKLWSILGDKFFKEMYDVFDVEPNKNNNKIGEPLCDVLVETNINIHSLSLI